MFFFLDRISTASSSKPGAMTTSVKMSATVLAMPAVTVRFAAITPPKAETGSQACALACASAIGSAASAEPTATPPGVGVLDDRDGRLGEVEGGAQGGVGVDEVVVAHGLAVQLVSLGDTGGGGLVHIQGGLLVRVFAVAQLLGAFQREADVDGSLDHAAPSVSRSWLAIVRMAPSSTWRCARTPCVPGGVGSSTLTTPRRHASPPPRPRSRRDPPAIGDVGWFFAAERTIAGPPMSMLLDASSCAASGRHRSPRRGTGSPPPCRSA